MDFDDAEFCRWEDQADDGYPGYTEPAWLALPTQQATMPAASTRSPTKFASKPPVLQPIVKKPQQRTKPRDGSTMNECLAPASLSLSACKSLPVLALEQPPSASIQAHSAKQSPLSMVVIEPSPFTWSCARVLRPAPVPVARDNVVMETQGTSLKATKSFHCHEPRVLVSISCRVVTSTMSDTSLESNGVELTHSKTVETPSAQEAIDTSRIRGLDQVQSSPQKAWVRADGSSGQSPLRSPSLKHWSSATHLLKHDKPTVSSHVKAGDFKPPRRQSDAADAQRSSPDAFDLNKYGFPAPRRQSLRPQ